MRYMIVRETISIKVIASNTDLISHSDLYAPCKEFCFIAGSAAGTCLKEPQRTLCSEVVSAD